jgi:hypothetical protein
MILRYCLSTLFIASLEQQIIFQHAFGCTVESQQQRQHFSTNTRGKNIFNKKKLFIILEYDTVYGNTLNMTLFTATRYNF